MQDASLARAERPPEAAPVEANPHRWALSLWARTYRRFARRWHIDKHVHGFCRPLTIHGQEYLSELESPSLIIANHTSHFDTVIALSVLPGRIYDRTAVAAAADRMYRERIKGMFHSLRYNAYPITRGGGREALLYSAWLLRNGWSLLIFPEGRRSRSGDLLRFHAGPAMLALGQGVPVAPLYIKGANDILPPGSARSRPAAVSVRVGKPLTFPRGMAIPDAREAMEQAVLALARTGEVSTRDSERLVLAGPIDR